MATLNTPYKGGNVGAVSNEILTVTGFTPDANDVGRLVCFKDGPARHQFRRITAINGQDLTLAHSLDTSPLLGVIDNNPNVGDSVYISYNLQDMLDLGYLTFTNSNVTFNEVIILEDSSFLHLENVNITWASSSEIIINSRGGLILGFYQYVPNEDCYVENSCSIIELADSPAGQSIGNDVSYGAFEIYGGSVNVINGNVFWRLYGGGSVSAHVRIIDVDFNGDFGGRVNGNKSVIIAKHSNSPSTAIGFLNPLPSVARFELSSFNSRQAGYINLGFGSGGRLVFNRIADIYERLIRLTGTGSGAYEVIGKKSEIDNVPAFVNSDSNKGSHIIRYGNLIKPSFINADTTDFLNTVKCRLVDNTSTVVNSQDVNDSQYDEFFARHTDLLTPAAGDYNLSQGTSFSPYVMRIMAFGFQIINQVITAEDTFESKITLLIDNLWSGRDIATIDALPEINNAQDAYDAILVYLFNNFNNDNETLVELRGDTLFARDYNVVLDATAGQNVDFDGSTLTLKSNDFINPLQSTGTITLQNGAQASGGIIDSVADSFLTFENIASWTVYTSQADLNAATNPAGSGTGSDIFRFTFSSGTSYFIAASLGGSGNTQTTINIVNEPQVQGETIITLAPEALQLSQSQQLESILSRTMTLNENIKKASLSVPAMENFEQGSMS